MTPLARYGCVGTADAAGFLAARLQHLIAQQVP
jgi:hypothetical protein